MKRLLSAVVLFFTVSMSANALFHIEPYLGYKKLSGENSQTPKTEYDFSGVTYGARLGLSSLGFFGGLDYSMASGDWESEVSNTKTTVDSSQTMMGLFVGYELPILLRAWATYYMDIKHEVESGSNNGREYSGGGYGLGVGYTGLPFVSLNLELKKYTYDEYESATGTKVTLNNGEHDYTEMMVSVSLPLDL
jgi:hypothetical protein